MGWNWFFIFVTLLLGPNENCDFIKKNLFRSGQTDIILSKRKDSPQKKLIDNQIIIKFLTLTSFWQLQILINHFQHCLKCCRGYSIRPNLGFFHHWSQHTFEPRKEMKHLYLGTKDTFLNQIEQNDNLAKNFFVCLDSSILN